MTPKRRTAANAATEQGKALRAAAAGAPRSPVRLRAADRPFWQWILRARLAQEWAPNDLVHAAHLARTFADIEAMRRELAAEGAVLTNEKSGITKANPKFAMLDTLSRRSMALVRILQLHALAKVGPTRDQGTRKGEALTANATLAAFDDDDLLAKPMQPLDD